MAAGLPGKPGEPGIIGKPGVIGRPGRTVSACFLYVIAQQTFHVV